VIASSAEGILGQYLRNALHSEASAELLKPIADVAPTVLGTVLADATAESLDRALGALPRPRPGGEPLERNARFAAAEFGFSGIELDILLLALRLRRNRSLARFCSAVQDVLRDPMRTIATLLGCDLDEVQGCLAAGAPLLICGLIELDPDETYGTGFASALAISQAAAGPMFAAHIDRDAWRAALIGRPCQPDLPWPCFDHLGEAPLLAARVLAAAASAGEAGLRVRASPSMPPAKRLTPATSRHAQRDRQRCGSASPCCATAVMPPYCSTRPRMSWMHLGPSARGGGSSPSCSSTARWSWRQCP